MTYELFKQFEEYINVSLKCDELKVHVVFVAVARNQLIDGLIKGRGDIVAAQMTITPEREKVIGFSQPATNEMSEVLVTGPSATPIKSLDDLSALNDFLKTHRQGTLQGNMLINRNLRDAGWTQNARQ